jgi:hypothetical protein
MSANGTLNRSCRTNASPRGEHRLQVRAYSGFRPFTERDLERLGDRFVEGALEHERPSLLLGRLWEILRGERVERPSIDRMIRLVAWARERAHGQTFERVRSQLTGEVRGTGRFDLEGLPPNRRAWLAQTGRQQTNQALARMAPERRYPVLMAFCAETLERTTDDAIEIYDRALGSADRTAQRKREDYERRARRDTQAAVRTFIDLSGVVLEAHNGGGDVLRMIERGIGIERLRADRDRAQGSPGRPTPGTSICSTPTAAPPAASSSPR